MDDLRRILEAQAPVYETAISELRAARKKTHWMWFVFPQLKGLGRSSTAMLYGLHNLRNGARTAVSGDVDRRLVPKSRRRSYSPSCFGSSPQRSEVPYGLRKTTIRSNDVNNRRAHPTSCPYRSALRVLAGSLARPGDGQQGVEESF